MSDRDRSRSLVACHRSASASPSSPDARRHRSRDRSRSRSHSRRRHSGTSSSRRRRSGSRGRKRSRDKRYRHSHSSADRDRTRHRSRQRRRSYSRSHRRSYNRNSSRSSSRGRHRSPYTSRHRRRNSGERHAVITADMKLQYSRGAQLVARPLGPFTWGSSVGMQDLLKEGLQRSKAVMPPNMTLSIHLQQIPRGSDSSSTEYEILSDNALQAAFTQVSKQCSTDGERQEASALDPALFSVTGRPLPVHSVTVLANGTIIQYKRGQVVAVVLPPDAASIPLALLELLEDVAYTGEGNSDVYGSSSFRGNELAEAEGDVHCYIRVEGECRVAGSNIARAVRVHKKVDTSTTQHTVVFELEVDEWDSLALLTLGE